MAPTIEFSRRLVVHPWPDGGMSVDVSADGVERGALARRFDLLEVGSLHGHGRLERLRKRSELVLRGWLEADVVQSCVVTLEPVAARIRQPIERRYRLGAARGAEQARLQPHGQVELDDDEDEVEPVSGREIDVGEALAEELGLALDPYPRSVGAAALDVACPGPHISLDSVERPSRPFAALLQLNESHAR